VKILQDLHSSAWYLFITSSRAFAFWLDLICFLYTSIVTFSFIVISNSKIIKNVLLAMIHYLKKKKYLLIIINNRTQQHLEEMLA